MDEQSYEDDFESAEVVNPSPSTTNRSVKPVHPVGAGQPETNKERMAKESQEALVNTTCSKKTKHSSSLDSKRGDFLTMPHSSSNQMIIMDDIVFSDELISIHCRHRKNNIAIARNPIAPFTEAAVRKAAKRISEYRHAHEEEKRRAEAKAREERLAHKKWRQAVEQTVVPKSSKEREADCHRRMKEAEARKVKEKEMERSQRWYNRKATYFGKKNMKLVNADFFAVCAKAYKKQHHGINHQMMKEKMATKKKCQQQLARVAEVAKRVRERSCAYMSVPGSYILKKPIEREDAGPRSGFTSQTNKREKETVLPVSYSVVVPPPLKFSTADIDDRETENKEGAETETEGHPIVEESTELVDVPIEEAKAVKEIVNYVAFDVALDEEPKTKLNDERLASTTVVQTMPAEPNLNIVNEDRVSSRLVSV
jgi:hypothetical protein